MREGYTLVWWGWEMDALPGLEPHPDAAGSSRVIADGSSITGIVRSEIVTPAPTPACRSASSQQIQFYPRDSYDSYPDRVARQPRAVRRRVRAHA